MYRQVLCGLFALSLLGLPRAVADDLVTFGDRHPSVDARFPDRCFYHVGQGGRMVDVTQAPFLAKGDGVTDDTDALVRAIDFAYALMDETRWTPEGPERKSSVLLYLPNGTYLVSDTVIYSGTARLWKYKQTQGRPFEKTGRIRLIGQSREGTVIKLKDNLPSYNTGKLKHVVAFSKYDFNNAKAMNAVRNLTIDTGRGNPDAVALEIAGANTTQTRNVLVRSGDGKGKIGLHVFQAPTIGCHHDITVDGFDYGIVIDCEARATNPVFEYITLANIRKAGIFLERPNAGFRQILHTSPCPLLEMDEPNSCVAIIDSKLRTEGVDQPAFRIGSGYAFLRNIRLEGFSSAILDGERVELDETLDEYVSHKVYTCDPDRDPRSLRLPIEEFPTQSMHDFPHDQWTCPEEYGAVGDGRADDSVAIQKAMDSGKPVVYFSQLDYRASRPITVPASVRVINGLFTNLHNMQWVCEENAGTPLRLTQTSYLRFHHQGTRTVVFEFVDYTEYTNADGVEKTLFANTGQAPAPYTDTRKLRFFGRAVNNEHQKAPIVCDDATFWILGEKCEWPQGGTGVFHVKNGGALEVISFTAGVRIERAHIINEDSDASLHGCTSGFGLAYSPEEEQGRASAMTIVKEVAGGEERRLLTTDFPRLTRSGRPNTVIPLYVGRLRPRQE